MTGVREATHAGSWYTGNGSRLRTELDDFLSKVTPIPSLQYQPPVQDARAIIAPHAGYSYSGPAAAWAYAAIPSDKIKRVVLLGPSHHVYLDGIALSGFSEYETPLGNIPLDTAAIKELHDTGLFTYMKDDVDEDEHSLEMHLPYIRHMFAGRDDLKLVPLLVGHPSEAQNEAVSAALQKLWDDPETFFIVSTDFCHWGERFRCTPYYPSAPAPPNPVPPVKEHAFSIQPPELVKQFKKREDSDAPIWKSIQYMDHEGMDLLRRPAAKNAVAAWEAYLSRTKNTICGRNPITVLLNLLQHRYGGNPEADDVQFNFVRYEQSSQCTTKNDSSVSYVSGVLRPHA